MNMKSPHSHLSTQGVLIYYRLKHEINESWVDWAVSMLLCGYDSPSLMVLAGESQPFNQFELRALVGDTLTELDLPIDANIDCLAKKYACELVNAMISGEKPSPFVLRTLYNLCVDMDYVDYLFPFYLLFYAQDDLRQADRQYYWPDMDRTNVEQVIQEYAQEWLAEFMIA